MYTYCIIYEKNQTASRALKNYIGPQLLLVPHFPAVCSRVYLYIYIYYYNVRAIAILMISWPSASILNNNKNTSFVLYTIKCMYIVIIESYAHWKTTFAGEAQKTVRKEVNN